MRLAIVSDYYYPQLGGITEHVHGQASELVRRGHDVTVVIPRMLRVPKLADGHDLTPPFELVRVGRAFPFYVNGSETLLTISPRTLPELDRLFRAKRFDVVHVHNPFGPLLPITAAMRSLAPVTVGTVHSVVPEGYKLLRAMRPLLQIVFRRLDERISVSPAVGKSIGPYFPDLSFRTIPNGIDTDFFSPAAPAVTRVDDKRTIIFVGRFDPRNGVKHMIGAFTALRRARSDVRLIIVGDGPLRPLVERLVPEHLREDVVFAGRVDRLRPGYLASADILCSPCSLASFGMVLLEGMSAGLPIVASRLPGFEFVMRDGIDGLMIDRVDDEQAWVAALNRLLDDQALRQSMGRAGRERALDAFAWPLVVDRLEALYDEILLRKQSRAVALDAAA
jgi:phosphatidyl-myo-inositol alpha-mannosyltransferase